MIRDSISNRELSSFSLIDLQRYLKLNSWNVIDQKKHVIVFEKNFNEAASPLILYVPSSNNNTDYFDRIGEIVRSLSVVSKNSISSLVSLIGRTSNDILKLRIPNPGQFSYSIPLDVASNEVDALKRLFMFGATSEQKARPFFDQPTTIGRNHANQCRFGHTFEGSFGFTINSPIIDDYEQLTLFQEKKEVPFERKVMQRVVTGFNHIRLAKETNDPSAIVDNFETGLNSKMCDAIIDLSIEKSQEIEFNIEWSPQIIPEQELLSKSRIVLDPVSLEIMEEASKQLKKVQPFEDVIIGKIVTLHSNKIPFGDDEFPRIAIIKHFYDNKTIEVKLELSRDEYQIVYDAHGKGQTVKVVGNLYRKGSTWRMIEIRDLEIFHS